MFTIYFFNHPGEQDSYLKHHPVRMKTASQIRDQAVIPNFQNKMSLLGPAGFGKLSTARFTMRLGVGV